MSALHERLEITVPERGVARRLYLSGRFPLAGALLIVVLASLAQSRAFRRDLIAPLDGAEPARPTKTASPTSSKKTAAAPVSADKSSVPSGPHSEDSKNLPRRVYAGKVVLLQAALKKQGIESRDEFKDQVALETTDGELIPIIPDWRGRAFFQDKRLRDRAVELVAIRRDKVPFLQVLMVFAFDEKGKRQYVDYWCDRCSIPMYEIKPCECCQDDIRLRFQPQALPTYLDRGPAELHERNRTKEQRPTRSN